MFSLLVRDCHGFADLLSISSVDVLLVQGAVRRACIICAKAFKNDDIRSPTVYSEERGMLQQSRYVFCDEED